VALLTVITQLADLGTSFWGLNHGRSETNPLYHQSTDLFAMKYLAIAVAISALVLAWRLSPKAFQIVSTTLIFFAGATFMQAVRNVSA
jgi:hypothetical protein